LKAALFIMAELEDIQAARTGLVLFLTLHALSCHVGIPFILGPIFFSAKVARHPVFINWCFTLELLPVAYILLLYFGEIENPVPAFNLCLIQASMIYASGAMIGTSTLIFSFHIYRVVRRAVHPRPLRWHAWHTTLLVIKLSVPYAVYLVVFMVEMTFGISHKQLVHRSTFYCTIGAFVAHLGLGIASVTLMGAVLTQVLTLIKVYRYWKVLRNIKGPYECGVTLSLIIRTLILTALALVTIIICLAFMTHFTTGQGRDLAMASVILLGALTFGTQEDTLGVYRLSKVDDGDRDE